MPDETKHGQDAPNTQSTGATGGTQSGADQQQNQGKIEDLPTWAQTLVKELRNEAADRRIALQKQQQEAATAEQKRLADLGQWETLAKKREEELQKLTPYQQRAADLEKVIADGNAERIALIPEAMRGLVPTGYPAADLHKWLNTNLSLLTRKSAPDIDAGVGSGGSGAQAQPLTEAEQAMAKRMGLTPEKFAAAKAKK